MLNSRALSPQQLTPVLSFLMLVFVLALVKNIWIADDAAITLRTVLNFLAGHGPVFNIGERVQAYTHPLWFGLLSLVGAIVGNVFFAAMVSSMAASLAALWLLFFALSRSSLWALFAGLCLLLSSAFMDFAVSGLENPLSYLLLALFGVVLTTHRLDDIARFRWLALLFSACFLTRPDLVLLIAPGVLYGAWQVRRPLALLVSALPGIALLLAWELFSLIYYGFPLANPAYAKLGTGIPASELLIQGGHYVLDSIHRDPVTLLFTALALTLAWRSRDRVSLILGAGIVIYLIYILLIGGDFMSGRFFSQVVFAAAILVVRQNDPEPLAVGLLAALVLLVTLVVASPDDPEKPALEHISSNGIADERAFYFRQTGLVTGDRLRYRDLPDWSDFRPGEQMEVKVTCGNLGFYSIHSGPQVHYVDTCALAEPLLARLPAKYNSHWRVGHYDRHLPRNYEESLRTGRNTLEDAALNDYLDKLQILTRAPVLDWERIKTIAAFNLGHYDHLINTAYYRQGISTSVNLADLAEPKAQGSTWDALGNLLLEQGRPLVVQVVPGEVSGRELELSLDHSDTYVVRVLFNGDGSWSHKIPPQNDLGGMRIERLPLPIWLDVGSIHRLEIEAMEGDGFYSVGHLIFR